MSFVLRDLDGRDEMIAAEHLQRAVWGEGDMVDPADLMMVIQHEGGLVAGAFDGAALAGYVFAFPTRDPSVQHSHRLAVRRDMRGSGLGLRLKWHQRDWCLARGIGRVRWTYDPLRVANANLNIARLGAGSSIYLPDYYGAMAGINAGMPSDRLLVEWELENPGVAARAAGRPAAPPGAALRVTIPADIDALLAADPQSALSERMRVRAELSQAFARGLCVRGFDAAACQYLLED